MEKTVDTASINNALQLFAVEEGRIPGSLDELVQKKIIPQSEYDKIKDKIIAKQK